MAGKIQIHTGFASPSEVARELGMSKFELQAIESLLNKPALQKRSPSKTGSAVKRSSRSKAITIWQAVKASKERLRRNGH